MRALTRLELALAFRQMNTSLRFGQPARVEVLSAQRCAVYFEPDAIFAHTQWRADGTRTTLLRFAISQALSRDLDSPKVVSLMPGAQVLLSVAGELKVSRALSVIETIEQQGIEPADVNPTYWRLLNNRLAMCLAPLPYTPEAHAAYLSGRHAR
jgi:Protein of unknown function (DUF2840)